MVMIIVDAVHMAKIAVDNAFRTLLGLSNDRGVSYKA